MIVRAFKMKEDATDEQCQALSDKLLHLDKLLCVNEKRKEIVARFDDELDLLAFQLAIGGFKVKKVVTQIKGD